MLQLVKKEQVQIRREREKLMKSLGGIKGMSKLPGAMFVIDPSKEHIAVAEARKLEIPVIAVTDTNCNPDLVDFVVPGNDDAIRAIRLFCSSIADAVLEGKALLEERMQAESVDDAPAGGEGPQTPPAAGGDKPAAPAGG